MSLNKHWFKTLKTVNAEKVLLGNNKACVVEKAGTKRIKMENGTKSILKGLRFVLDL